MFENWWEYEGSSFSPSENEDIEEFAKRITKIAWHVAENKLICHVCGEVPNMEKTTFTPAENGLLQWTCRVCDTEYYTAESCFEEGAVTNKVAEFDGMGAKSDEGNFINLYDDKDNKVGILVGYDKVSIDETVKVIILKEGK